MNQRTAFFVLLCLVGLIAFTFGGCFETDTTEFINGNGDNDSDGSDETPTSYYGCQSNLDCSRGQTCFNGECRTACTSAANCDYGEICRNTICSPAGTSVVSCATTGQCLNGRTCVNGWCRMYCDYDRECATGEVCRARLCSASVDCLVDTQCPRGQECYRNVCFQSCDTANPCTTLGYDCNGQICVSDSSTDGDVDEDDGLEIDQDSAEADDPPSCEELCDGRCGDYQDCDCGGCQDGEVCNSNRCLPDTVCTSNAQCGDLECGTWSECRNFATQCATTGRKYRDCVEPYCDDGGCFADEYEQYEACARDTDGFSCDAGSGYGSGACYEGECIAITPDEDEVDEPLCPFPTIEGPYSADTGSTVTLELQISGGDEDSIDQIRWNFVQTPEEVNSIHLTDSSGESIENTWTGVTSVNFVSLVPGTYIVMAEIKWADAGCSDSTRQHVVGLDTDIPLQLKILWTNAGNDFDVHLVRDGGTFSRGNANNLTDCHWTNCTPAKTPLDWGESGTGGNPLLVVDDIQGSGPEIIEVQAPLEDGTYLFAVEWYSGTAADMVQGWVYSYGQRLFFGTGDQFTAAQYHWNAANIIVTNGVPSVSDLDTYEASQSSQ